MILSRINESEETQFSLIDHNPLSTSLGDFQQTTISTFCKTNIKHANTTSKLAETLVG
jgi:hypothetical protein